MVRSLQSAPPGPELSAPVPPPPHPPPVVRVVFGSFGGAARPQAGFGSVKRALRAGCWVQGCESGQQSGQQSSTRSCSKPSRAVRAAPLGSSPRCAPSDRFSAGAHVHTQRSWRGASASRASTTSCSDSPPMKPRSRPWCSCASARWTAPRCVPSGCAALVLVPARAGAQPLPPRRGHTPSPQRSCCSSALSAKHSPSVRRCSNA